MDELNKQNNIPEDAVSKSTVTPPDTPSSEKEILHENIQQLLSEAPKTPYDSANSAPTQPPVYGNQPYYNNPTANFNATGVQAPKKEPRNTGKIVFVGLVCLCVVIASIIVGVGLTGNNSMRPSDKDNPNSGVAIEDAIVEDSPISYSEYSGKGPMTAEQVYQAVKDINVGIIVYSNNRQAGEGSGIIAGESKDKQYTYILTAAHVIADEGVSVLVQFNDGSEVSATIVGIDEKTDIGVVRIKKSGLKLATFGNSAKLSVGQTIYAIGNPGGTEFFGSFTSGTISAIDRPVPTTNSLYDLPCIQHDAAINPGNSGGALINEYGQVIGLNSAKISSTEYEGMGFSVPSDTMLQIYNELIKNGYVSNRPMLGITYYPVTSNVQTSNIAFRNGLPYGSVVIATLSNSSDMINHGIKVGDIITAVNGKKLDSTDVLLEAIEQAKVGDKLTLTFCRINANGNIETTFDAKVALVEDTGDNGAPMPTQEETTQDPYSHYFEDFGDFGGFGY